MVQAQSSIWKDTFFEYSLLWLEERRSLVYLLPFLQNSIHSGPLLMFSYFLRGKMNPFFTIFIWSFTFLQNLHFILHFLYQLILNILYFSSENRVVKLQIKFVISSKWNVESMFRTSSGKWTVRALCVGNNYSVIE